MGLYICHLLSFFKNHEQKEKMQYDTSKNLIWALRLCDPRILDKNIKMWIRGVGHSSKKSWPMADFQNFVPCLSFVYVGRSSSKGRNNIWSKLPLKLLNVMVQRSKKVPFSKFRRILHATAFWTVM